MRHALSITVRILLGAVTIAVAAALFLSWRLEKKPLDLESFSPRVEQTLSGLVDDGSVSLKGLQLTRHGLQFQVRAQGVELADTQGNAIATADAAIVEADIGTLLRTGRIAARKITLEGLHASAVGDGQGFRFGQAEPDVARGAPEAEGSTEDAKDLRHVVGPLAAAIHDRMSTDPALQSLEVLALEHARLTVTDVNREWEWHAPNVAAVLERQKAGIAFHGGGLIRQKRVGGKEADRALGQVSWDFDLQPVTPANGPAGHRVAMRVELADVDPAILQGFIPPLVGERGLEASVSGEVRTEFLSSRALEELAFSLRLGEGKVTLPAGGNLQFSEAEAAGGFTLSDRRARIDKFVLRYGNASDAAGLELTGTAWQDDDQSIAVEAQAEGLDPGWLRTLAPALNVLQGVDTVFSADTSLRFDPNGDLQEGKLALNAGDSLVDLPGILERPITAFGFSADLTIGAYGAKWQLEKAEIALADNAKVTVSGTANRGANEGLAELSVHAQNFTVAKVLEAWPIAVSPPARAWIAENIHEGRIPKFKASVRANIGARGQPVAFHDFEVDGRMPLRDVRMSFCCLLYTSDAADE